MNPATQDVVFLFDVDNTLLDNDRIQADLRTHLAEHHGERARDRYWQLFEELRSELGYADYLGALERYRVEDLHDPRVLRIANWLADYPFPDRLYAGALDAVRHARQWGQTVILSDGDAVFQPRKVECSGLWRAFEGPHPDLYPQGSRNWTTSSTGIRRGHYVLIDDKLRILDAVKKIWGNPRHHGVSPPGPLRARSRGPGHLSPGRHPD